MHVRGVCRWVGGRLNKLILSLAPRLLTALRVWDWDSELLGGGGVNSWAMQVACMGILSLIYYRAVRRRIPFAAAVLSIAAESVGDYGAGLVVRVDGEVVGEKIVHCMQVGCEGVEHTLTAGLMHQHSLWAVTGSPRTRSPTCCLSP